MFKLLVVSVFLLSSSAFATICEESKDTLTRIFSEKGRISTQDFTITNVKETINPILAPIGAVRDHGCSLIGVKITADVEYKVMDKICSGKLVKPSYSENEIRIENNICENQ